MNQPERGVRIPVDLGWTLRHAPHVMSSSLPDPAGVLPRYRELVAHVDGWFARALQAHREDGVQCGAGCCSCCIGLFDISSADQLMVAEGYRRAAPETRRALRQSARTLLDRIETLAPEWERPYQLGSLGEERFDALCDALATERCVALDGTGLCQIYDHRPLICRLHGLPMYDPLEAQYCGGACELNFPPVDLADKPALHFAHAEFCRSEDRLIAEASRAATGAEPQGAATIVAAAILEAARTMGENDD